MTGLNEMLYLTYRTKKNNHVVDKGCLHKNERIFSHAGLKGCHCGHPNYLVSFFRNDRADASFITRAYYIYCECGVSYVGDTGAN